jgi:hypothetical protein
MKLKRLLSRFLALGFVAALGGGPLAASAQASSRKVCGQVTAYVKPTALATGALTINGVTAWPPRPSTPAGSPPMP